MHPTPDPFRSILGDEEGGTLQDPDVKCWYRDAERGSRNTAEVHLRRLSLFCEQNGVTPKELVNLGRRDRKRFEDMVRDHVTKMELGRKSLGYIAGILKGVKSWLVYSEVELKRRVKIRGPRSDANHRR